jgi:CubicO group peptidase (beta-lactamase class C family)
MLSFLWIALVAAAVSIEARWFPLPEIPRGDHAAMEEYAVRTMRRAEWQGTFGSAGLVLIRGGKVVAEQYFGAHREPKLYKTASVSKAVTSWGVLKLVQAGTLHLDEPVLSRLKRWRFPGSNPEWAAKVTIRHLLSHTAGFQADDLQLVTAPGTEFRYSNSTFYALQNLVEDVTGQPFHAYMRAEVLLPLGMSTATYLFEDKDNLATSFDSRLRPQPHRRDEMVAAVGLYASARDLAQFARAFHGPIQPQPAAGSWGLGHNLFVRSREGGYITGHDGGSRPAWGASVRVNPFTGNGLVLVTSGGQNAMAGLPDTWVYWESGEVNPQARWDSVYRRMIPASVLMICGVFLIWRMGKHEKRVDEPARVS